MPRGQAATNGTTRVAKNGYHYTKVDGIWKLTHWITAEKVLGRPLEPNESVRFVDPKFKRDPYNEAGIQVIKKKTSSLRKRQAVLEQRIADLQHELDDVNKQLKNH